ncbi:hypothetical protein ACHHYP_02605 [Achlya hypogyna]|uniref:Tyrosinase copper-binding domain-containing protein n=1 Tax=Achlya hypogyna TaxID=1202772 RepID=A0A1V9Z5U0_ACHHY|nr:hypothetical protein ACHHYP_02605 [Achlya hypogyna]
MSASDKTTFIAAVRTAMQRGLYQVFVQIHAEAMTNKEAHGTCVFLFWHRRYILGFENMLRSLGPQFACITLPYIDFVQVYLDYQAGLCNSLQECAVALLDLGGSTNGVSRPQTIFNKLVASGTCVKSAPLDAFYDNSTVGDHCVSRGPWLSRAPPVGLSFANIVARLFSFTDIKSMSAAIESLPHNNLHNTLGGAMGSTTVSPSDPVFFLFHAFMDLLHSAFYRCLVLPQKLTVDQKQSNVASFESCVSRNNEPIGPKSKIRMQYYTATGVLIDVTNPASIVYPFFATIPNTYYELAEIPALPQSYTYYVSGLLTRLFTQCSSARARRLAATQDHELIAPYRPQTLNYVSFQDDVTRRAAMTNSPDCDAKNEIIKMLLMHHDMCLADIEDYSPEFKKEWRIQGKNVVVWVVISSLA